MNSNDVVNLMFKWELELYKPQIKWDDVVSSCKIIQQSELIFCERKLISIAMRLFCERRNSQSQINTEGVLNLSLQEIKENSQLQIINANLMLKWKTWIV